ncbi:MAG: asparagine synthetase B, partial [Nitrospina sp.]|nr:asparagine synthetase B [Nitrospina sp.]
GFAPPSSIWLRGIFSQTFESIFTREKVESLGIFHYPEIQRMFQMHLARKADYGRHLWALLSFQLWYDRYIDGNPNH